MNVIMEDDRESMNTDLEFKTEKSLDKNTQEVNQE